MTTEMLPLAPGDEDLAALNLGGCAAVVNHIALVVRDVGDSTFFYTDIVGFKQVPRVNFDRHGAWLSMGNIQLHLIKGQPHTERGGHPDDLIVSHIALEVPDVAGMLQRLERLQQNRFPNLAWRQNVSVPTLETSAKQRFEKEGAHAEGKLTQFFLEDPDGYWLEFCNCGVHEEERAASPKSSSKRHPIDIALILKMKHRMRRLKAKARQNLDSLLDAHPAALPGELPESVAVEEVDEDFLQHLCLRRNTYGDICQGFSEEELREALSSAGNCVPGAIWLLRKRRELEGQIYKPPAFLNQHGATHETSAFRMPAAGHRTDWGEDPSASPRR